ncbi:MAG TPA: alkene reductase [Gammaproteobacteria bacterium]|nr:alkene reductase [Gammaproteobacteria bacterium]
MTSDLFSPISVGKLELPNRVVMAPLTRNRAGEGNVPTDLNVEYYRQRASAALIITEATQVAAEGVGYPATPGIHTPEQVAGWRKVTDAVHAAGGHIFCQLWFCGRISHPSMLNGKLPVAPSAIRPEGEAMTYEGPQPFVTPKALSEKEIEHIIGEYGRAARLAREAGFDGVEVHAANGYLIDQFLRDGSNQRDDRWGGSLENRARFLTRVLDTVFEAWQPNEVGVRLSPENRFNSMSDSDPAKTFEYVAHQLSGLGLAYLHVLEGDMLSGERTLDYRHLRDVFGGIYMANCGYTLERAQAAIANGDADLVAFGQLYIANPDLVERFREGAPLNTPDPETFYGGDAHGYTDYPFLESETVSA